jgi:hypothetical protein
VSGISKLWRDVVVVQEGVVSLRCGVTVEQLSKFISEENNMQREDSEGEAGRRGGCRGL